MSTYDTSLLSTPSSSHSPYLVVRNVSKSFGTNIVLDSVSFAVSEGEFVSILGPSGSGKSTLLRLIAGLESPDSGEVVCDNTTYFAADLSVSAPVERRDIGMVFQDFGLWPHLTVLEHVTFPLWSRKRRGRLRLSKREITEQALQALHMFRMQDFAYKRPHELSGGQQQRIAFARAVVARPSLVLLDEAFSALDPQLRAEVRTELVSILRDHRMTVLNVTHDQEEAMAISDHILVLHQGSQLQFASPQDLYERPANRTVAAFVGRGSLIPVQYDGHVTIQFPDGQRLLLPQPLVDAGVGEAVEGHLLIRPEFIRVKEVNSWSKDEVSWHGRVTRQTALIGRTELYVDLEAIGEVFLYHHERLEAGENVELQLHVRHPHLILDS